MKKLKVIIEKTRTGYSAYAVKIPVYSTGANVKELMDNVVEGVNFYRKETGERKITARELAVSFSVSSVFDLYPINLRHFADRIGMNYTLLAQYVQGRKKPSEKQTSRIVEGLQEIGKELSSVQLIKG